MARCVPIDSLKLEVASCSCAMFDVVTHTLANSVMVPSIVEAIETGSVDHLDAALAAGTQIDESFGELAEDGLMLATRRKSQLMVSALLERGANCRYKNASGDSALHLSCLNGELNISRLLLAHGSHIDEPGDMHNLPIHLAAAGGHEPLVVLLILRGCALSSNANGAFPSALASGFERVKKILSEIESEGEPARERLRIRFARQMASDAMEQRLREQEEERHRQELVEAERNELRKRDRERQEERSALLVECEQLKSQIEELEEKEANRLREEEKKRKLRAKKKSKSTTRG